MWDLEPEFGSLITRGIAWQRGHIPGTTVAAWWVPCKKVQYICQKPSLLLQNVTWLGEQNPGQPWPPQPKKMLQHHPSPVPGTVHPHGSNCSTGAGPSNRLWPLPAIQMPCPQGQSIQTHRSPWMAIFQAGNICLNPTWFKLAAILYSAWSLHGNITNTTLSHTRKYAGSISMWLGGGHHHPGHIKHQRP